MAQAQVASKVGFAVAGSANGWDYYAMAYNGKVIPNRLVRVVEGSTLQQVSDAMERGELTDGNGHVI